MGKAIQIKLVPSRKDKLYQPESDYSDIIVLMNKLHFNTVNEAIKETKAVQELELHHHQAKSSINTNNKEESTLNILSSCLETLEKQIKIDTMKSVPPEIDKAQVEDYNKILEESDTKTKETIKPLELDVFSRDTQKFLEEIKSNLEAINKRKSVLSRNNKNLKVYMQKIDTIKENIVSSNADIDLAEVALKNIKIQD